MLARARAQVWSYAPEFRRPRHFHAEPELNIVVHGSARFGVGNTLVDVSAGELLGFSPGQDHVLLQASSDLALLALGAKQEIVSGLPASAADSTHTPLHFRPRAVDFAALVGRAEAAAGCANESRAAELWEMVACLARSCDKKGRRPLHVLTRRALGVIGNELELGRGALAKQVRGHPTELSRYFHRDVGVTLVRYRTRLRLLAFIDEIDGCGQSLATAALLAGFGSYSQCHRAFVSELGCAPSEFFSGGLRSTMADRFEPCAATLQTPAG